MSTIMGREIHKHLMEDFLLKDDEVGPFIKQLKYYTDFNGLYQPLKTIYTAAEFGVDNNEDYSIAVVLEWDTEGLNEDIYAISKGMREVCFHTIHKDFIPELQDYLDSNFQVSDKEGTGGQYFTFKKYEWAQHTKGDYVDVVIYRDKRVEPVIDYANSIKIDEIKEVMLGFILGYSVFDMGRWIRDVTIPYRKQQLAE